MILNRGIIFDFDGVLADTVDVGLEVLGKVAHKKRVAPLSKDFIRNHETIDIIKALNIKWWEFAYYNYKMRKWMLESNPNPILFPWSEDLLNISIKLCGQAWIVSSSSGKRIINCLNASNIDISKLNIYSDVGILQKDKVLKNIIKLEELQPNNVVYVGDETRDMRAGYKAGVNCLGVAWGLHSPDTLKSINNTKILYEPKNFESEICKIIF